MNDKLWWYVARAGGLTAWWLVSASVLWGLLLSTRVLQGKPKPPWLLDLHRFLGGLSVVFTGVHILGLVADSWAHFGWVEVLVPFASSWRPAAVAWGVVGFYLLLAVEATSLLMRKLPRKWWRRVHLTSFGLFALSGVHAFTAGNEADNAAVQVSGLVIATAFVFLVAYRLVAPRKPDRRTVERAGSRQVQRPDPLRQHDVQAELGDGDDRQRLHDGALGGAVEVGPLGGVGLGPGHP